MKELNILLRTNDENLKRNVQLMENIAKELKEKGWGYMENGKIFYEENREVELKQLLNKYLLIK